MITILDFDVGLQIKMFISYICLFFFEGASDQDKLTSKLNQLNELVQQRNKLDDKLRQELQKTKDEHEKDKEKLRKELNERETRERSLKDSKRKLEAHLTEMKKESNDLHFCGSVKKYTVHV